MAKVETERGRVGNSPLRARVDGLDELNIRKGPARGVVSLDWLLHPGGVPPAFPWEPEEGIEARGY